jgi:hypothetical protein
MGIKVREGGAWVEVSSGGGSGGSSDPVGTIVAWAGSVATIPSEYQLCDGSAASTSELQAITGSNVPDLTDRFIVGASNSTGDNTYPGLSPNATPGGSANSVLIAHNHTISPTTVLSTEGLDNTILQGAATGTPLDYLTSTGSAIVGKDNTGANSTSQTGTNANLPPYYALCYIIKHTATSGGGSGSGGTDAGQGFFENDTTLNTSTTLSSNKNVGVFGPYTIGNNVTLTVPTGTTFTVV